MNPFSRFLSQWSQDRALRVFVQDWDLVEALVIKIYRQGRATEDDEAHYRRLRSGLLQQYSRQEQGLQPLWRQSQVAGKPTAEDPFMRLLRTESAGGFVGDWVAMQNLPAAREALNRALLRD